jgi:uncharacterized RDD family membrane protein YckC
MEEVTKANRLIAGIIDSVVGYVPMMIMAFVTGATGIGALMYIGYLVTIGYYLFKDALLGGQSIGKKAMKYAAVNQDGSSLDGNFMASATRNVSVIVPLLGLYEAFLVLTDKKRLGDEWAKTKVVNKA